LISDLEVHKGTDNGIYALDFGRFLPPEGTSNALSAALRWCRDSLLRLVLSDPRVFRQLKITDSSIFYRFVLSLSALLLLAPRLTRLFLTDLCLLVSFCSFFRPEFLELLKDGKVLISNENGNFSRCPPLSPDAFRYLSSPCFFSPLLLCSVFNPSLTCFSIHFSSIVPYASADQCFFFSFSAWADEGPASDTHNDNISLASIALCDHIASFASLLNRDKFDGLFEVPISPILHRNGINVRHIGMCSRLSLFSPASLDFFFSFASCRFSIFSSLFSLLALLLLTQSVCLLQVSSTRCSPILVTGRLSSSRLSPAP